MEAKFCKRCRRVKDVDEFSKDIKRKEGLRWNCKSCDSEMRREYYNRPEIKQRIKEHYSRPDIKKRYREYNREKYNRKKEYYKKTELKGDTRPQSSNEYSKENYQRPEVKSKCRASCKEYYEKNKVSVRERMSRNRKTPHGRILAGKNRHKRATLHKNVEYTLTLEQWMKILKLQDNKCVICGKRFTKKNPPTKDHIIPLSRGGAYTFENIQAIHHSCNSSKGNRIDKTNIVSWIRPIGT